VGLRFFFPGLVQVGAGPVLKVTHQSNDALTGCQQGIHGVPLARVGEHGCWEQLQRPGCRIETRGKTFVRSSR
jgi:hypothetical protein